MPIILGIGSHDVFGVFPPYNCGYRVGKQCIKFTVISGRKTMCHFDVLNFFQGVKWNFCA